MCPNRKVKQHSAPVSYALLEAAVSGDAEAVRAIECIYEPYMRKLATLFYPYGTTWFSVDLYDRLRHKLLRLILMDFVL